jgi:hypothetical protein
MERQLVIYADHDHELLLDVAWLSIRPIGIGGWSGHVVLRIKTGLSLRAQYCLSTAGRVDMEVSQI